MHKVTRRALAMALATLALLFVGLPSATADPDDDDICPAGFTSATGMAPCEPAPIGYYADQPGLTMPLACLPGTYTDVEASQVCADADPGYFVDSPMATSQQPCDPGTYTETPGAEVCSVADPGYFADGSAATGQEPCPVGRYQPSSGAESCLDADAGHFVAQEAATDQEDCGGGRFQPASAATFCIDSDPGSYAPGPNSTFQIPCAVGEFQALSQQSSCDVAPAGTFVSGTQATEAQPCQPGFYQPDTGQTECIEAPAGTFVADERATEADDCQPGFYQPDTGQTECIEAPAGTFVAGTRATEPTPCPPGTVQPLTGQTSCINSSPTIVLVAGSSAPPAGDVPLVALLESAGYTVIVVDDDTPQLGDAVTVLDPAVVVVSSTVVPNKVGSQLAPLHIPIVVSEAYLFDDFGITSAGFFQGETAPTNQLDVVEPDHPIADGLAGRQFVTSANRALNFARTNLGTTVARDRSTGRPVIVAFEEGDAMSDFGAPARRVALFAVWNTPQNLNATGQALVLNAIAWANGGGSVDPVNAPPEVDAGADQTILASDGATTVAATVDDDGLAGPLTFQWSGPQGVIFNDDNAATTGVAFPGPGVYELTLTVNDTEFDVTDTMTVTVREEGIVVGLVSSRATGTPGDRAIIGRIEAAGADVVIIDDDVAAAFDVSSIDALFISTSVSISTIGDLFKDVDIPVAVWEGYLFDDMDMALRSRESPARSQIVITDPSDPLAAGLTGTPTVYTSASPMSVAILGGEAESIAHEPSFVRRSTLFRIEAGNALADGSAAADLRIGFFPDYFGGQRLTGAGVAIVDAVIDEILTAAG